MCDCRSLAAQSGSKGPPRVAQGAQKAPQGRPGYSQKVLLFFGVFRPSFLAYGLLFLACGLLCLAYGLLFLVYGLLFLVY